MRVRPRVRHTPRVATRLRSTWALTREARRGGRAHGAPAHRVAARLIWLRRSGGFEYDEALAAGLADPAMPRGTAAGYVSRHVNMAAQRRLNGSDMPPLVAEKLVFQRFCEGHGIPVPPLLGVIDRAGAAWTPCGHGPPRRDVRPEELPETFIVKPAAGYEGHGVQLIRRGDDGLLRAGSRTLALGDLLDELRRHPEFGSWIVQRQLRNHPDLARLGGEEPLHTVRIVTLVDRSGATEVLWSVVKLGTGGGPTDNFRGGATGNTVGILDPARGSVTSFLVPRGDGCGFRRTDRMPGTGLRADGIRIPAWAEARALVESASAMALPLRTLGWDVAVTPDGPVVVEANSRWGATAIPFGAEIIRRLDAVAGVR